MHSASLAGDFRLRTRYLSCPGGPQKYQKVKIRRQSRVTLPRIMDRVFLADATDPPLIPADSGHFRRSAGRGAKKFFFFFSKIARHKSDEVRRGEMKKE